MKTYDTPTAPRDCSERRQDEPHGALLGAGAMHLNVRSAPRAHTEAGPAIPWVRARAQAK